jgi:hypothetical protein
MLHVNKKVVYPIHQADQTGRSSAPQSSNRQTILRFISLVVAWVKQENLRTSSHNNATDPVYTLVGELEHI